jgi:hypothetical protein
MRWLMVVRIYTRVVHDIGEDRSSEFTLVHSLRDVEEMGYPLQTCSVGCFSRKQPVPIRFSRTSMVDEQIREYQE